MSIFATMLSSITYMSMPAKSYATDWIITFANLPILLLAPVVIAFFLPIYRRMDATSAYEYLEKRFNYAIRVFGALSFVLLHIGRTAVVLYLPSLALSTVSDLDLSMFDTFLKLIGLTGSALAGLFILGIFKESSGAVSWDGIDAAAGGDTMRERWYLK